MKSGKILIVEDELIISKSIVLILEQEGYTSAMVTSGEEALELIPVYMPDLILMDIGLSGKLDGVTTANIISHQYNVPVIFITDQVNYQVYRQAQTAFPCDYISKPFTEATLIKAVEAAFVTNATQEMTRTPVYPLGERVDNGIFILFNGAYQKEFFSDILYIVADGSYTKIHCANGRTYNITLSSNNVVAQLACPAIVKTAKSYYVNIHRVDSITSESLVIGTTQIPMTQSFKPDILSRLKKLVTTNKSQQNDVFE